MLNTVNIIILIFVSFLPFKGTVHSQELLPVYNYPIFDFPAL